MCSRDRRTAAVAVVLVLAAALVSGCGSSDGDASLPAVVSSVEPACADTGTATSITIRGTMPVKPVVSLSGGSDSTIETGYRAWVGEVELTDVRWVGDGATVTATVPRGIAPGAYPLTIESPFGERVNVAYEVATGGVCGAAGAPLAIAASAGPAIVQVGGRVVVSVTVRNTLQATVTGVTTSVAAPTSFEIFTSPADPLDIPAGQSRTFTWTYTALAGAGNGTFAVNASGVDSSTAQPVTAPQATSNAVAVAYHVGGTVVNLTGSGLVLQLNGANDLPIAANAPFTFGAPIPSGTEYTVSVLQQPAGSTCRITGATGTVTTAPVTSVQVNCDPTSMSLSTAVTGTGTGTLSCNGGACQPAYGFGTVVTVTAVPGAGSTFAGWSGDCTGNTCTLTMNADRAVTATFTLVTNALTVTKVGSGTVAAAPATPPLTCTATSCTGTYDFNTAVTLTAVPDIGWAFTGWSGSGCSGTGACTVTMNQARNVTATFTLTTHILTVTKSGTGAGTVTAAPGPLSCGPTCSAPYSFGTQVTLTAAPDTGSVFGGWSEPSCSATGLTCVVTVQAATTVQATFTLTTPTLTVVKAGTGSGTVTAAPGPLDCGATCTATYDFGTPVTLTAALGPSTVFGGWSEPSCGTNPTCPVTMTADRTVTATFVPTFTVGGTVSGLLGNRVELRLTYGDNEILQWPVQENGGYTFPGRVPSGTPYTVDVIGQPNGPAQLCTVANRSGVMGGADVANVDVSCGFALTVEIVPASPPVNRVLCDVPGDGIPPGPCAPAYGAGTTVNLTPDPTSAGTLITWLVDGAPNVNCLTGNLCVVTLTTQTGARTVTATFTSF